MKATTRQRAIACVSFAFAVLTSASPAQEAPGPEGDPSEGTALRTALEVGVDYTDNFFYAPDGFTESGSGLLVRPEIALTRKIPRFTFTAAADAEAGWYDFSGDADDYVDYAVRVGGDWESAARHRFEFNTSLQDGHDPFGTARTENSVLENRDIDTWRETHTEARYLAGLPSDRINFEFKVSAFNREYTNNEEFTQFLSYEGTKGSLTTFVNLTPKTAVFALVAAQRTYFEDIALGAFDRGATTLRYLVGARWAATAKTSGDFRVGYVDRDPRDASRENFQRFDWLAEFVWAPRAVRKFLLQTGRAAQESYLNTVDFIDNRYGTLIWVEQWTPRLRTQGAVRYMESTFVGTARQDELLGYSLSSEYAMTPFLTLLGRASSGQRDSEVGFANYERFYAYLGLRYER